MSALVFVDTNVIVYRFDSTEPSKQRQAEAWLDRLWATRTGRVSTQVLHETYATLTRKLGLPRVEARRIVRALHSWEPLAPSLSLAEKAWHIEDRWAVAWWDALIVAAAFAAGARYLLSEDLQNGQEFDAVRVVNPFSVSPDTILPLPAGGRST